MDHSIITHGDVMDLKLKGKFTFADNKTFSHILDEIAASSYKQIVIDLKEIEFIDSAALGILLLTRDKCKKSTTSLVLKSPQGQVKQMFEISRFGDLFTIEA